MFIKTDDQNNIVTYPYSLDQFRAENTNRSLPRFLNNRFLATKNVYPVYSANKPEYDEINQNIRPDINNPYLDTDGVWKYGWTVTEKTSEQKSAELEKAKIDFKNKVNKIRDDAIYQVQMVNVNENTVVPVDLRKDHPDIQNISGLTLESTVRINENNLTPFYFRGADDNIYELSPQEMLILGKTISSNYSEIYAKSWALKDQIKNMTTIEEINTVEIVI